MTPAQLTALKADIAANTNTIDFGGPTQIKNLPNTPDANAEIAAQWYNKPASPAYWVWRFSVSRSEIYNTISDLSTSWDWTFYKGQSVPEQNAWTQMFMGDEADFSKLNLRVGISKIFTAGSAVNRDHALAVGRRTCLNIGKLLATAVLSPPANTGNDGIAGNRGKTTNPDVLAFDGTITGQDVTDARNLP